MNNDKQSDKFSIRTTEDQARIIRLAYSDYRHRRQIVNPDETPKSMNAFLAEGIMFFISELAEGKHP